MPMWLKVIVWGVALVLVVGGAAAAYAWYRIRNLPDTRDLAQRVDKAATEALQEADLGTVAVAVLRDGRTHVRRFGSQAGATTDTVRFEIGSITKVFTAIAAHRLVGQGAWQWSTPIWPLLPPTQRPPVDDGTTLEMLATHTSGLPRLPESWFARIDATADPYASITENDVLAAYASGEGRTSWRNAKVDYSNLGFGLLGVLLERQANEPYDALVQRLVLQPLGMQNTGIALNEHEASQLATGRDESGKPTPPWSFDAMAGAGAYRSTIEDMARFLQAAAERTPMPAFEWSEMWAPRKVASGESTALGWQLDDLTGRLVGIRRIVWHNGGTGGFSSWMGFDPERRIGVVVLASRSSSEVVDELGMHLLYMTSHTSFAP